MGFGIPASIQAEVTCSFGEITEERKLSTFTRVNQCQYWVFRRSLRFGTSHRGFACCSANSGRINTQNHYWVIIRLWFRKPKCIILSNSREVDEHAGGTNRLHITLCTLRCSFWDAASLPTVIIPGWKVKSNHWVRATDITPYWQQSSPSQPISTQMLSTCSNYTSHCHLQITSKLNLKCNRYKLTGSSLCWPLIHTHTDSFIIYGFTGCSNPFFLVGQLYRKSTRRS